MTKKDKEALEVLFYGLAIGSVVVGAGAFLTNNNVVGLLVCLVVAYGLFKVGQIFKNIKGN